MRHAGKPEIGRPELNSCRERLHRALPERLRRHLIRKLKPGAAAERASAAFEPRPGGGLTRPKGGKRNIAVAYEYRNCIKLGTAKSAMTGIKGAFQHSCGTGKI